MVEYVLERFLYRLAVSPLGREHFVLKGGLLLAQFGARRMTRYIDILGRSFAGTETEIVRRIAVIAATEIDDGVAFDPATLKTVPIREEDEYHGVRLSMAASIARARLKLQLDVSFGDPVTPGPRIIDYPQQLTTESFQILGYPRAARLVGIRVRGNLLVTFVIAGTLAGVAGVLQTARTGGATADTGTSLLFPALAAVFLGATAIEPGRFNVLGTVIGVLFVSESVSGLTLSGASDWVDPVFNGAALLLAVGLFTSFGRKRASGTAP